MKLTLGNSHYFAHKMGVITGIFITLVILYLYIGDFQKNLEVDIGNSM
jgi:hypothetical protein